MLRLPTKNREEALAFAADESNRLDGTSFAWHPWGVGEGEKHLPITSTPEYRVTYSGTLTPEDPPEDEGPWRVVLYLGNVKGNHAYLWEKVS